MARTLGDGLGKAWVAVAPQDDNFTAKARAIVTTATRGLRGEIPIDADTSAAVKKIAAIKGLADSLSRKASDLRINVDDAGTVAKIAALQARIAALQGRTLRFGADISDADLARLSASALGADAAFEKLRAGLAASAAATKDAGASANITRNSYTLWGTAVNALTGHVRLFGGALPGVLGGVAAWHIALDSVFEATAVLLPATVALGAAVAAQLPTWQAIYQQMTNLHTVTQAFGANIYPLTGAFQKLAQSVQPQTYELFGEALVLLNSKGNAFSQMAQGASTVLDRLGARMVAAVTTSSTFNGLLKNGVSDLSGLGNAIGNIFGAIGNLLKAMPGYAEQFLKVFGALTGGLETLTRITEPILQLGLAFHGVLLWGGLAGTVLTNLARGALSGMAGMALNAASGVERFGKAGSVASRGLMGFGAAAEGAASIPFAGWAVAAGVALGGLVFWLASAKDATQKFYGNLQQLIQQAPAANLLGTITSAQAAGAVRLADATKAVTVAQKNLNAGTKQGIVNHASMIGVLGVNTERLASNVKVMHEAQAGQAQLNQISDLANSRIAALGKQYGGTKNAMALLSAAGITSAQITDRNTQNWRVALVQIAAYASALRALGTTGVPRYDAAMNALAQTQSSAFTSMQKVTSAQDTLLNTILGSQQAFINFAQIVGPGPRGAAGQLSQMGVDARVAGASIGGLNKQSLAYANDFYSTALPAAQKQIDALNMQGASTKQLTRVTATMAGQLLAYAGNNDTARATVVALINNALGPNTVSFRNLNSWVKNNSTSMTGYQSIVGQVTVASGGLYGAITNATKAMFQQDLMLSAHVAPDMRKYTDAIINNGVQSNNARAARQRLIDDLIKTGMNSHDAQAKVDSLARSLNKLPSNVSTNIHDSVSGSGQVTATATGFGGGMFGHILFKAAGGKVPGFGGGDSRLAMLEPGELVIPKGHAGEFASAAKRKGIPGFASGGVVGSSNFGPLENQLGNLVPWTNQMSSQFAQQALKAFIKGANNAVMGMGGGNVPFKSGGNYANLVAAALKMLGYPMSLEGNFLRQIQTESGGNLYAVNHTDSNAKAGHPSTGILQLIAPTYSAYVPNNLRGVGPFLNGVSINPWVQIVTALRYAHAAYGSAVGHVIGFGHGYAMGGNITEPIQGFGLKTGQPYSFGEGGRIERYNPGGGGPGGGSGGGSLSSGDIEIMKRLDALISVSRQSPQQYGRMQRTGPGIISGGIPR